jgi:Flp pilus assembly protein protease CpaA
LKAVVIMKIRRLLAALLAAVFLLAPWTAALAHVLYTTLFSIALLLLALGKKAAEAEAA